MPQAGQPTTCNHKFCLCVTGTGKLFFLAKLAKAGNSMPLQIVRWCPAASPRSAASSGLALLTGLAFYQEFAAFSKVEELEALRQIPRLEQWPGVQDVPESRVLKAFYTFAELEALKLALQMVGISHTYLISIYKNKFVAENLSKLRIGRAGEGQIEEDISTQLVFEGGIMVSKKLRGTLKDFGNNIDIWAEGFYNYMIANCVLYSTTFPNLLYSMLRFYNKDC
jgi:hypothetical protein